MSPHEPPAFDEPWHAQVFALTLMLNRRGVFTWSEWTETLGRAIAAGPQQAGNDVYYACWLDALESILIARSVTDEPELAALAEAWRAAAAETAHGTPIVLTDRHRRRPTDRAR